MEKNIESLALGDPTTADEAPRRRRRRGAQATGANGEGIDCQDVEPRQGTAEDDPIDTDTTGIAPGAAPAAAASVLKPTPGDHRQCPQWLQTSIDEEELSEKEKEIVTIATLNNVTIFCVAHCELGHSTVAAR